MCRILVGVFRVELLKYFEDGHQAPQRLFNCNVNDEVAQFGLANQLIAATQAGHRREFILKIGFAAGGKVNKERNIVIPTNPVTFIGFAEGMVGHYEIVRHTQAGIHKSAGGGLHYPAFDATRLSRLGGLRSFLCQARNSGAHTRAFSLRALVKGESGRLEFKGRTGQRTDAAKTVCAMLNGLGGFVVFGVGDKGELVGQEIGKRTVEEVTNELSRIDPPAFPEVETVAFTEGRSFIVLRVSGSAGLYNFDGRYYLRVGPNIRPMPRHEYRRLQSFRASLHL